MNRLSTILLSSAVLLILIVFLAWLRPRIFDEKLIFTPEPTDSAVITDKCLTDTKLYLQVFETKKPDFNETVIEEIKACFSSHHTRDFVLALACIQKGIEQNTTFPNYMRDKQYLRSVLVACLRTDLYRLYDIFQQYPNANHLPVARSLNGNDFSDYLADAIFWILKEFTFKKRATLNEYWKRIEAFENGEARDIKIERRWTDFGFDNFYGEMILNFAIPSVNNIIENIEKISI